MRESKVERYLRGRVLGKGGLIRKLKWISHAAAPDRFVVLHGQVWLVEVKAPGEKPRPSQQREHDKLRAAGVRVAVVDTVESVNAFVDQPAPSRPLVLPPYGYSVPEGILPPLGGLLDKIA